MPIVILLIAAYLLLVFVLPLTLSAAVSYRSLPVGRACPQCAGETIRIQARLLGAGSILAPATLHRRFCLMCGWEGVVRLPGSKRAAAAVLDAEGLASLPETVPDQPETRTMDVRWLTVDGVPWRVQLECWRQTGVCYGRLVFVEPSGRHWLDLRPLAGRTDRDVLGQALSLPDRFLASRLRELVSD
ncbi:MAG: hypothetical protein ACREM1_17690 [Longimicrobiales bacterium]